MVDVYEEKACCGDNPDACCGGNGPAHECECDSDVVEIRANHWAHVQEHWDTVQENLGKAAADVRNAVSKGVDAAEPVFRERVAPVLADATAKLAELANTARKTTSEKAGFSDDEATPVEQIGAGLAGVATGLLGLIKSLGEWSSHQATSAAEAPATVTVEETVEVPVDAPQETVYVETEAAPEYHEGENQGW